MKTCACGNRYALSGDVWTCAECRNTAKLETRSGPVDAPRWQKTPPTSAGAYWLRYVDQDEATRTLVVNVEWLEASSRFYVVHRSDTEEMYANVRNYAGALWAGPLAPPSGTGDQ